MSFLMGTFRNQTFANRVAITFPAPVLATLANAGTAVSDAINNSIERFSQYLLTINCAGTAAATAWLDVRLLVSTDKGLTYGTWESSFVLEPIVLSATPQVYQTRILAPEYWKLAVLNNTGQVLTAGTAFYQGIRG